MHVGDDFCACTCRLQHHLIDVYKRQVALSYDHRVIDGGSAARFAVDLAKAFENFGEEAVKI